MGTTKVLLVGSGAREHAIADALIAGGAELYAYMQLLNPGIKKIAKEYAIGKTDDTAAAVKFAKENSVELAVIGPETPLAAGVVDELEKAGIKCVGPTKKLAQLETSKGFTRQLLKKHRIEGCPEFKIFNDSNKSEIKAYLEELGEYVVKPDGLTGGKGVKVFGEHLNSHDDALNYCSEIMGIHTAVVVEEKLEGEEFSLQTLTDGNGGFLHFPVVQDHKRAFDGDSGPNTGGMGSYSDSNHLLPFLTAADVEEAKKITEKVAAAIKKELGESYKGVMYGGFMKTAGRIKLLEYNARFGDPEAMNVLPLLKTNFVDICKAVVEGKLAKIKAEFEGKATVCKYVVPEGYPDNPVTGKIVVPSVEKDYIKALVYYAAVEEKADGTQVAAAIVRSRLLPTCVYTTKSRGVAFVGVADTIPAAEKIAEEAASMVKGKVFHRKDIGTWQLVQKRIDHIKKLFPGPAAASSAAAKMRLLYQPKDGPMKIAAFMSGTGTIVRKILEFQKHNPSLFKVSIIFTDTADETACNARKIAEEYKVAYYCNDIKEYYAKLGHNDRKDMKIRQEYDAETAKLLRMHKVDVVALCGYMSIVTRPVIDNFLTINVHPADLRIKDERGRRKYAGCMGSECVLKVMQNWGREIRSTTHIVTEEVDAGQLLMVSQPVFFGPEVEDALCRNDEPELLEKLSHSYQEKLKEEGDWKIYPETILMLAQGRFSIDKDGRIYLDDSLVPEGCEYKDKESTRDEMRRRREGMDRETVESKSNQIAKRLKGLPEYEGSSIVMLYAAKGNEVQTHGLIEDALKSGKRVLLPITSTEKNEIEIGEIKNISELKEGAFGIMEPAKKANVKEDEIELVVVPGLGFGRYGGRIGYGKGYYDKLLKRLHAVKIGLAYYFQVMNTLPAEHHDRKMDLMVTESEVIRCSR